MNRMDAGIFFYRPTFSKKGTSPTKMGEFLACGIPCLSNTGVGDVEAILEENRVGFALDSFEWNEKEEGVDGLLTLAKNSATPARCRSIAESYYSLQAGVSDYDAIYQGISEVR
jgi:glycosyltransferase involved in cell wall biosynthesis